MNDAEGSEDSALRAQTVLRWEVGSCEAEYARIAASRKDNGALDSTVLRTGSFNGREVLAWTASRGRLRYSDFAICAEAFREPARRRLTSKIVASLDPEWAVRLARVMALQELYPDDRLNGLTIFRMVLDWHGPDCVSRNHAKDFCDLAISMGDYYLARAWSRRLPLFKTARLLVQADLTNPFIQSEVSQESTWWTTFSGLFTKYDVPPPRLRPVSSSDCEPFDRIQGLGSGMIQSGPLVTIAVSTYKPDAGLLTSVRSLLEQTWSNLEVIVVDDGSPDEFSGLLEECANLSDRVRIIHLDTNRGTYVARNTALDAAQGDFFTTQDADDWSHPARIQTQVEALLGDRDLMACRVLGVRVSGNLVFARPASKPVQENASSLMFRRAPVMSKLGYFDSVRKGADTEYALRIERVLGGVKVIPLPLTMIRISSASLSRSDFRPNWRHPARVAYREAYDYWHALVEQGIESPYRANSIVSRPFPAPRAFWVDREAARITPEYDFVFIGDWRQYGGPQKSMLEEIGALLERGYRIGICHMEAFRFMSKQRGSLCVPVRELLHSGVVSEVSRTEEVTVKMVVLRYPPILQYTPGVPFAWKIERARVVANQSPHHMDGSDLRYNVTECIRNARALFGVDPVWVPQGPQVRAAISSLLPADLLHELDVPGIISVDSTVGSGRLPQGERPVIGRYSRDNPFKFPASRETLLSAYPADADIRVRIMGGLRTCKALLGADRWPENWEMLDYNEEPVDEFLSKIDFFVNFDNDDIVEAFGRSMLEAMASGCVVILPMKFRGVFGEGAVYADAAEVGDLVKKLHADPDTFRKLSAAGIEHVRRVFSHEVYADRMARELDS